MSGRRSSAGGARPHTALKPAIQADESGNDESAHRPLRRRPHESLSCGQGCGSFQWSHQNSKKDPFLAYAYVASIPFFVALHRAFKVLGYAGRDRIFSRAAVDALRTIKLCAIAIIGFVAVGEIFIILDRSDDRAGGVFMGVLITFGSIVMATAAAVFERILQNAVEIKSENDLTV